MTFEIFPFLIGLFLGMLIDSLWWHIDHKKVEKGFEILEHYHIGLILFIPALILSSYESIASSFLFGLGILFIFGEWHQSIEICNRKVIPGKPFAYGSTHFQQSTIIGIVLTIITISLFSYTYLIN